MIAFHPAQTPVAAGGQGRIWGSASWCAELSKQAALIGAHEFLGQPPVAGLAAVTATPAH
jgi:hypothetical protein